MRKSLIGAAVGGLVATAALGSAAYAASTYTVSVDGTSTAGTHLFYASDDGNGIDFAVKRLSDSTITPMFCTDVNAEGEAYSGPGAGPIAAIKQVDLLNAPDIAAPGNAPVQGTEWKNCKGPFNLDMTVMQLNEWEVYADPDQTVTSALTDSVTGFISGPGGTDLKAHVFATSGGKNGTQCNFEVHGSAGGTFDEATQQLRVSETGYTGYLTVKNVKGNCLGLVVENSPADFSGVFNVGADDSANTKGNITEELPINLISSP